MVTESSPPSSHLTNDSNQERSRPNSPATRMPNSRRSPSPSASSKQSPGTSASPDRSFVDVVINPGYVSPPRSPVRVPKKPIQRSFKPWVVKTLKRTCCQCSRVYQRFTSWKTAVISWNWWNIICASSKLPFPTDLVQRTLIDYVTGYGSSLTRIVMYYSTNLIKLKWTHNKIWYLCPNKWPWLTTYCLVASRTQCTVPNPQN